MAHHVAWKDDIIDKLIEQFKSDGESLARILYYLEEEDNSYRGILETPPAWKMMKNMTLADQVLAKYTEHLVSKTRTAELDQTFRAKMGDLHLEIIQLSKESSAPIDNGCHQAEPPTFDSGNFDVSRTSSFILLAKAWPRIPPNAKSELLTILPSYVTSKQLVKRTDQPSCPVNQSAAVAIRLALTPLQLTSDLAKNVRRWWQGHITGKRIMADIVHTLVSIGVGLTGSFGGAVVGSLGGPFGTLTGCLVGGIFSANAASFLCGQVIRCLSNISKDEILDNGHKFVGVDVRGSNREINTTYRNIRSNKV